MRPEDMASMEIDVLRGCGLSARKAEYLLDLAGKFTDGTLHRTQWESMDDEAIITELVKVRGIGRWTAEMFLVFNLQRPDVLPLDDLGLQRAVQRHYFRGRVVTSARIRKLGEAWQPWRSVATWYLWRSLEPVPVEY